MGADGIAAAGAHPWRLAAAQVFVQDLATPELSDADSHHLSRVLRLADGSAVCATDGAGGWRLGTLVAGSLAELQETNREPERTPTLTVGFAAPKGDRTEWAVRKLTEVGVDRIVLLQAERSVVRWDAKRSEKQLTKANRWTLESSRQCRRLWLPTLEIATPDRFTGAVIADAGGRQVASADTAILVGPEGGWTNEEREGREFVGLGEHILRTETAAVLAGSAMTSLRLWSE